MSSVEVDGLSQVGGVESWASGSFQFSIRFFFGTGWGLRGDFFREWATGADLISGFFSERGNLRGGRRRGTNLSTSVLISSRDL